MEAADRLVPGIMAKHCQNQWLLLFLTVISSSLMMLDFESNYQ
jgi:hypothetical protein